MGFFNNFFQFLHHADEVEDDYPDINTPFGRIKNSVYDWLAESGGQVDPLEYQTQFAEEGPFDVRQRHDLPGHGERARLNGRVVTGNELNHRLFGMALAAGGYGFEDTLSNPYMSKKLYPDSSIPAHLKQRQWIKGGVNAFHQKKATQHIRPHTAPTAAAPKGLGTLAGG
jgi:hypothetical protein